MFSLLFRNEHTTLGVDVHLNSSLDRDGSSPFEDSSTVYLLPILNDSVCPHLFTKINRYSTYFSVPLVISLVDRSHPPRTNPYPDSKLENFLTDDLERSEGRGVGGYNICFGISFTYVLQPKTFPITAT